jgi:hypothetical protein
MKALPLFAWIVLGLAPVSAQTSSSTTSTTTTTTTAPTPIPAPVTTPSAPNPLMERMLSSLTPAEKDQIIAARTKAMADNPGLQTEEMGLMEKGMMLQSDSTTPEDREEFRSAMKDHVQKVRAAMLKADPTIQPILTKLEAQGAKMRAEQQGSQ